LLAPWRRGGAEQLTQNIDVTSKLHCGNGLVSSARRFRIK
jgi:hypothetical protein